jgi:acyl carrier protein phosphodiesterase
MLHPHDQGISLPALRQGVLLHRAIDTYTDGHPAMRTGKALLRPEVGKYAPVVLDVYLDFLLFDHWAAFVRVPFTDFEQEVYGLLTQHMDVLPDRLHHTVRNMVRHQWLRTYTTTSGREDVFARMRGRVSRPNMLNHAAHVFERNYAALSARFLTFFPDIIEEVRRWTGRENPWLIPQSERKS